LKNHFSASQVSTYELCPRKWAWRYIEEVFSEPNASAELGTLVHQNLEKWLADQVIPESDRAGKIARSMLRHLPAPQAVRAENVERGFQVRLGGHLFVGYTDLFMPGQSPPTVYDHKTTSDFCWAQTHEGLLVDVQATLYSYWAFIHLKDVQEVQLQWTYGRTRGTPVSMIVSRTVTKKEIEPRLELTMQSAEEMALIKASVKTAMEVPYHAEACEAFGGCPYRAKCNLTPSERMGAIMSQGTTKQGFLAKLKARKANGAAETETTETTEEPEVLEEEDIKEAVPTGALARMKNRKPQDVNPPEQQVEESPPVEPEPKRRKRRTVSKTTTVASVEKGWTLYIGCMPVKLPEESQAPADAGEIIVAMNGTGEGRSGQLEAIRKSLRESPPPYGVVLDLEVEEQKEALFAFMQEATTVVQVV